MVSNDIMYLGGEEMGILITVIASLIFVPCTFVGLINEETIKKRNLKSA